MIRVGNIPCRVNVRKRHPRHNAQQVAYDQRDLEVKKDVNTGITNIIEGEGDDLRYESAARNIMQE
jgi:hypothetical protein